MKANFTGMSLEEALFQLDLVLSKLDFSNNFDSFEKTVTLPANSVVTIRNNLTFVPNRYIILSQEGNGLITKAKGLDSQGNDSFKWSINSLYLKNNGAEEVTIKIVFVK